MFNVEGSTTKTGFLMTWGRTDKFLHRVNFLVSKGILKFSQGKLFGLQGNFEIFTWINFRFGENSKFH